jgi:predicted glycosyltransferase
LKRILVAPLNWGLGHAARCIPLIAALEEMGTQVILASDGSALRLLKAEFPHLPAFQLPSYGIRYRTSNMVLNIARQLPRILWAIRAEQWATRRLVREHGIHGILSDNRYGCFSRRAHSVMLTHQLRLRLSNGLTEWASNRLLQLALAKFDAVWTPDAPGEANLSGELSHGVNVHPDTRYTGILSRMRSSARDAEYDVAVVLSGPEPQRTILEQRLLEQAMALPQKFIFVQGKTRSRQHYYAADHIEVVSYLTSADLNDVLVSSEVVVCRSGYSSIMDLAALGKKALLIPTPGQTEQEYLAANFDRQNIFLAQSQEQLDLEKGLRALTGTTGISPADFPADAFRPVLEEWVEALR